MSTRMFAPVQKAIRSQMTHLIQDEDLSVNLTWKVFSTSTFDTNLQYNVEVFNEFTVRAVRLGKQMGAMTTRRFPPQDAAMTTADVVYVVRNEDMPAGASKRDIIVDGLLEYRVDDLVPIAGTITRVDVKGHA